MLKLSVIRSGPGPWKSRQIGVCEGDRRRSVLKKPEGGPAYCPLLYSILAIAAEYIMLSGSTEGDWRDGLKAYLDLVRNVLDNGVERSNRTEMKTLSLFGLQARYDLRQGFPLVTTKKVLFDAVLRELLWFLRGSTNIHEGLAAHTPIWNPWGERRGRTGPHLRVPVAQVAALYAG